jgi:putative oxidoreductase
MELIKKYDHMTTTLSKGHSFALLIARFAIGLVFILSGLGKIMHMEKTIAYFTQLGIPLPEFNAGLVATCELLGGIMVFMGIFIEIAVIPLSIIMIVAIMTAKLPEIKSVNDLFGAQEFLFLVMFIWFFTEGSGDYSLDYLRAFKSPEVRKPVHHTGH